MGFVDDPMAKFDDCWGRVVKRPTEVVSRMGGVSSLNQGDAPLTKAQRDAKRKAETVKFGTFSRKGKENDYV
jgi:hypothetical protein